MPIPIQKGQSQKISRKIARLQRQQAGTTRDVRRLLYKARVFAIEAENGGDGASEEMLALLDMAVDRGMSQNAIRAGGGMVNKINSLLDRTESQSHALGLLLNAASMIADVDADAASAIMAVADSLDHSGDHEAWQKASTPVRILRHG